MPGPNVPFPPMEAELVRELPEGGGWQYEPKWDGFRGVLENDGGELALWSRNERPLLRYFPELRPLGELLPPHSALDGEIVIARDGVLDFDAMQTRLHPAESRIRRLSGEIPAELVVFDVLLWNDEPVWRLPLEERRARVEALDGEIVIARDGVLDFDAMQMRLHPAESRIRRLSGEIPAELVVFDVLLWDDEPVWKLPLEERRARVEALDGFRLSPATRSLAEARAWLDRFEAIGLDGVVAKRLGVPYLPGSRDGVVKVKEHKTADCVVVGLRWKDGGERIATLLLGLYREDGGLDYVGSCAVGARMQDEAGRRALPLLDDAPERRFSEPNRWGTGELQETALRPELVVEVRYDKVQGDRFRHGTKFIRWRDDKEPEQCTWRELRPPRDPNAPTVDSLFG